MTTKDDALTRAATPDSVDSPPHAARFVRAKSTSLAMRALNAATS